MITLPELLDDSFYRKFFLTKPDLLNYPQPTPRWRVWVQKESGGPWSVKEHWKYSEAFTALKPYLKTMHDGAIQCKNVATPQPTRRVKLTKNGKPVMARTSDGVVYQQTKSVLWVPKVDPLESAHLWCTYCRRPTIFRYFSRHHAFRNGSVFDPGKKRCVICGSSESLVRGY